MGLDWSKNFKPSPEFESWWKASELINCWDSLFQMKYTQFRMTLHEIQKQNFADVGFDKVIYINDPSLQAILASENNLIFPVDDDDWFHKDISLLPAAGPKYIRWNYLLYSSDGTMLLKHQYEKHWFNYQSNNYALRTPANHHLLHHGSAESGIDRSKEQYLYETLSLHNRTLSSLSNFNKNNPFEKQIVTKLSNFWNHDDSTFKAIPEFFMKYMTQVIDLHKSLKVMRISHL